MNREELLELIPAYALDALDDDERLAVESLLTHDAEAQSLLLEYEAVALILTMTAPQRPAPSHLRDDLKARLAVQQVTSKAKKTDTDANTSNAARILPFPITVITSAAAILIIAIGLIFVLLNNPTTELNPNEVLYNELIEQAGSQRFSITPELATEATGELLVSADGTQAVLRIAALPDIGDEESYQLWLVGDDHVQSGGLFYWSTGHGPYYVLIEQSIDELVAIGMTIEPHAGSPLGNAPTGERLFGVEIAQAEQ